MAAWVMEVPVSQQQGGGVGNGDVPVQRLLALIRYVLNPATVDQHAAVFQVIEMCPLGMQNGFKVGGEKSS
jgi:hypothetical protein